MRSKKLQKELIRVPSELHELYCAVRQMNTFVCEACHNEELNEHPSLGSTWNTEWYLAMAELAHERGWQTVPAGADRSQWFFEDFQLIGPNCTAKLCNPT